MFTGIIAQTGEIIQCEKTTAGLRIVMHCGFTDLASGESIAVNGACLTVVDPQSHQFACDLSPETCGCTTANEWSLGTIVNLERAMLASDRFGGHYVTGHVDGVCHVTKVIRSDEYCALQFSGAHLKNYLIPKGSITVNGVSLTINRVIDDGFEVMLIPHTLATTNLHLLQVNSRVNIEYDWMVKVVAQLIKPMTESRL